MKPKTRGTKSKTNQRRSHLKLKKVLIQFDEQGNPHLPHTASKVTGAYKGRQVVDVKKRAERHAKKMRKIT